MSPDEIEGFESEEITLPPVSAPVPPKEIKEITPSHLVARLKQRLPLGDLDLYQALGHLANLMRAEVLKQHPMTALLSVNQLVKTETVDGFAFGDLQRNDILSSLSSSGLRATTGKFLGFLEEIFEDETLGQTNKTVLYPPVGRIRFLDKDGSFIAKPSYLLEKLEDACSDNELPEQIKAQVKFFYGNQKKEELEPRPLRRFEITWDCFRR